MKLNFDVFRKSAGMLSSMVFVLCMTSCLEDDSDPVPVAYVSIFHASPDAPDLDVVLDDRQLFNEPLEYTDYSRYLQFYTGNRDLEFTPYDASNVLADTSYNFQAGKVYSVFVTNQVANLSTLIVEDEIDSLDEDKAWVRFIHLSPDTPALDFTIGEEDTPLFANRLFRQATDFTEVTPDTYDLSVKAAGDDDALVTESDEEFEAGGIYTVLIQGFTDTPTGNSNDLSIQIIQNQ